MCVLLEIVFPSAIGRSQSEFWNFSERIRVNMLTTSGLELGTSMPIVPRPGIGAIILIPRAERLNAMSSSRFLIFEIRMPGAGTIS